MPNQLTADQIIQALDLQPLPIEGGLYRQTYQSSDILPGTVLPDRPAGLPPKPFGTAIFYLLTSQPDSFSAFHRLPAEEIFHFYLGDPLEVNLLYPDGSSCQVTLGQDILNGQVLQFVVPRGVWQGSRVAPGGSYTLIGTTMAPGYTQDDYENGDREALLAAYPAERERILALTRV